MSGDRRRYRRRPSPETSSPSSSRTNSHSSLRASTRVADDDVPGGGHRRLKRRSSSSLPVQRRSPASHHSWVLLNRTGARQHDAGSAGDRATSATSRTSRGEEISVSFELVEPPGTSVLTVAWPSATISRRKYEGSIVAAHRDVMLLASTSYKDTCPSDSVTDLFVYHAGIDDPSRRRRLPPLSLLLLPSAGGPKIYSHGLDREFGIMSCTSNGGVDGGSPSFVVAGLRLWLGKGGNDDVYLLRSASPGQWVSFENLHVHGANDRGELRWWSTDAVLAYGRRRMMVWVDYYRGMILMDLSEAATTTKNPPPPPTLRYVPLPVNKVDDPEDIEFGGRECPKACRSVCFTRYGVKFVSVDSQHCSDFGVGNHHVLTWSHRFRITMWSLREHDYTWRRDLTMYEEEFWDAFDGGSRFPFPHVKPTFPVVDMDNPDVVVFRVDKQGCCDRNETKWMIEVDLRKKVLVAATAYSNKESDGLSLSRGAETINSARMNFNLDLIPSELPCYLDVCKRARRGGSDIS